MPYRFVVQDGCFAKAKWFDEAMSQRSGKSVHSTAGSNQIPGLYLVSKEPF